MSWYSDGLKFKCQGSGKCCVSRGEYGYVYMNIDDRRRMANELKMKTNAFTKKYCSETDGFFHLKENEEGTSCIFLDGAKCSVYKGRPVQCRTWPFWPENMKAKTWKNEVATYCPGIGKGKVHSAKEIEKSVLEQLASELKK